MSTLGILLLLSFVVVVVLSAAIFRCISNNNKNFSEAEPADGSVGADQRRRELGSDKLSLEAYYRPMRSILDIEELNRARQLEKVSPGQWKEFRSQRIHAFRTYLSDLKVDFRRLEFKLRYMALAGTAEDADLVMRLNKLKAQFGIGMIVLEVKLLAFQFGLGSIEVSSLLDGIEQLERALEPQRGFAASAASA